MNVNKRHFLIFMKNCTHKSIEPRKKQIVRFQPNEKKSKESRTTLMSWYWKRKETWRNNLITYNSHPWIIFSFNWLAIICIGGGGGWVKLDVHGQGCKKILDVNKQEGGVLKIGQFSWTSYVYLSKMEKYTKNKEYMPEYL